MEQDVLASAMRDHAGRLQAYITRLIRDAEAAAALGCTVATAKIRVHRGRQKLGALLRQHCTFSRDARNVFVCEPKSSPPA